VVVGGTPGTRNFPGPVVIQRRSLIAFDALWRFAALAAPAPPELRLAIQRGPAKSVRLAWPRSAGADCVLLAAPSLTGPWQDSGLPVGTEGEEYAAYDQASAGSKFYRLSKP
jgi:hypothetical protein